MADWPSPAAVIVAIACSTSSSAREIALHRPGDAAPAGDRARGTGAASRSFGKRARLADVERSIEAGERRPRTVVSRRRRRSRSRRRAVGELRRGTERLQQGDGLAREGRIPGIAHVSVHARELAHHGGGRRDRSAGAGTAHGLLVGRDGVAVSAVMVEGVAVGLEDRWVGPDVRTAPGRGPARGAEGDRDVEPERALAGEQQEAEGRRPQLRGERLVADRDREIEGGGVSGGRGSGRRPRPVAGLGFDPPRGGDVPRRAAGARHRRVGDVAGEDVPERVLVLARHRRARLRRGRARAGRGRRGPRATSPAARSPIAATAPAQKTFPITAASPRIAFVADGSASMRAARSAWIDVRDRELARRRAGP